MDVPRTRLQDRRRLDCLSVVCLQSGEATLAVQYATEAVALGPFRKTGYQRLLRAHIAVGNRAEALRVYERCRKLLTEEVGVNPSPELQSLYQRLLHEPIFPG